MVPKLKVLLAILSLGLTGAWPSGGKHVFGVGTSGAPYAGPGDIVSGATFWIGLRAYNNTQANAGPSTTAMIDVSGSSSGSCTIYLKGDGTGNLDLTTSGAGGLGHQCSGGATTFCTVTNTSCNITQFYDQTGNGFNFTFATVGALTFSCLGSLPCATWSAAAATRYTNATSITSTLPYTTNAVLDSTTTNVGVIMSDSVNQDFRLGNGLLNCNTCTGSFGAANNVFHAVDWIIQASITLYVDGTTGTGHGSGVNINHSLVLGNSSSSIDFGGNVAEIGLWKTTGFSGAQLTSMCQNQQAYYGSGNFSAVC